MNIHAIDAAIVIVYFYNVFPLSSSPSVSGLGQYPSSSYRSARIKPFVRERPSDHSETILNQPQIDRACSADLGSTLGQSTG